MQTQTFRALGAAVILAGVAFAAIAQTTADDPRVVAVAAPSAATTTTRSDGAATTADAEPVEYRVGLLAGPSTGNYWEYLGSEPTVWNSYVLGPTKPALFAVTPGGTGLAPEMASGPAAPAVDDGSGWHVLVELKETMRWSDGRAISARDVEFTFRTVRALDLGGGWAESFPAEVTAVSAVDDSTIRIDFAAEPAFRVWPHRVGLAPVMPEHVWGPVVAAAGSSLDLYGHDGSGDVSGGPLVLTSVDADAMRSEPNPGYPGAPTVLVTYLVFPDEGEAAAALAAGDIDTILSPNGLSAATAESLAQVPEVELVASPANAVRYLGFNPDGGAMTDVRLRRAMALLLDRPGLAERLVPGATFSPTILPAHNDSWYDDEEAGLLAAPYLAPAAARFEQAMTLLTSAGYAWTQAPTLGRSGPEGGVGLTLAGQSPAPLTLLTSGDEYDPARPEYAEQIADLLRGLGFEVEVVVTDFESVIEVVFAGDGPRGYDMYIHGWTLGSPSLPDFYPWLFGQTSPANPGGGVGAEFETALQSYLTATKFDTAHAAVWAMERALAESLPYIVLYHPNLVEAYRADRLGFAMGGTIGGIQGRQGGIFDVTAGN